MAGPSKIQFIRHAEKPNGVNGVDADGKADAKSLIVRGWQRAGALISLFSSPGDRSPALASPTVIYAASDGDDPGASKRPLQTIQPLADKLKLQVKTFAKNDFAAMLADALKQDAAVVLICWEHKSLAAGLATRDGLRAQPAPPATWSGAIFDSVWVFDAQADGSYSFHEVPQSVLAGDSL